ncbi:MAG: DUF4838 domain-containing protein [Kiritimatiellae bacterium]|nr:DUF4838 domain-containing protein [Kiritimatiellia bacterium]
MAKAAFLILSVFMAVPLSVTAVGSMLDVAVRGQSAEYVIVTSASASESQRYAAEELRDFIQKTTGVCLPIANDDSPLPAKAILLGETKYTENLLPNAANTVAGLGEDGFRLVARPPHLLVIASPVRGTLYGVYEILERFAGCRWYASWHSVIPKIDKLSIPADLDDTQVPAFIMRDPGWYDLRENPAFAARLRVNQFKPELATMVSIYGGVAQSWGMLNPCHTLSVLLPPKKYFAEHPEYYALVNGKRGPGAMSGAEAKQPCLTNPDVLRIVTSNVLEWIRREPQYPIYGVSQTDGWDNYCRCPDCAAVDEEEGSHSGTVVRFVNAVAEAVEREFPGKTVETLAYNWSRKPPAKMKLRDNVAVYLCTMGADHARSFPESPHPKTIAFREDLKGWQSICRNVMIWDYVTNFGHYLSPHPSAYGIFRNIPFYRDCGVTYLFTQADSRGAHASFSALMAWVEAKLMWNPDLPLDALLDEFFAGYYGDAAPFVREYFEELHRLEYDYTADPNHALGMTTPPTNPAIPDSFLDDATSLWAKAEEAVKGDKKREYNVRMGAITVDYMRMERLRGEVAKKICLAPETRAPEKFAEAQRLAKKLLTVLATEKNIQLSEGGHAQRAKALVDFIGMERLALPAMHEGSVVIEEKDIPYAKSLAGRDWGTYVDDPKADDGRATRLITLSSDQGVRYNLRNIEFEDGAKYRIRARVRVDKAGDGNAFHAGVLDTRGWPGTTITNIVRRTNEVSGEYEWYDVADYDPAEYPFASFFIQSGSFPQGGKPAVKGVYLDKIEISKVQ